MLSVLIFAGCRNQRSINIDQGVSSVSEATLGKQNSEELVIFVHSQPMLTRYPTSVRIYRSGIIEITKQNKAHLSKVEPRRVRNILKTIESDGFFKIDEFVIKTDIAKVISKQSTLAGNEKVRNLVVVDASTVTMGVLIGGARKQVSWNGLSSYAGYYPSVEGLQIFQRCLASLEEGIGNQLNGHIPR
jgi:hypothetical protein